MPIVKQSNEQIIVSTALPQYFPEQVGEIELSTIEYLQKNSPLWDQRLCHFTNGQSKLSDLLLNQDLSPKAPIFIIRPQFCYFGDKRYFAVDYDANHFAKILQHMGIHAIQVNARESSLSLTRGSCPPNAFVIFDIEMQSLLLMKLAELSKFSCVVDSYPYTFRDLTPSDIAAMKRFINSTLDAKLAGNDAPNLDQETVLPKPTPLSVTTSAIAQALKISPKTSVAASPLPEKKSVAVDESQAMPSETDYVMVPNSPDGEEVATSWLVLNR